MEDQNYFSQRVHNTRIDQEMAHLHLESSAPFTTVSVNKSSHETVINGYFNGESLHEDMNAG